MPEWYKNESFWKETYDFLFPETLFEQSRDQIEKVLELIDFKGITILDLCCGPGRCAIELARKDYRVTGVDLSAYLLDKAKTRSQSESFQIEWVQEDMRRFTRPGSFDLVLNMFTSFGYFENKNDDLKVLENIFISLKPGGVLIIDVMGKERLARIFQPTMSTALQDGRVIVQRPEIYEDWTRVKNTWTIIRGEHAQTFTFDHTVYSGQELKERLEQTGFEKIKLYGSLEGSAYDANAQRLIIVGRKRG